jgi:hypothetical protein
MLGHSLIASLLRDNIPVRFEATGMSMFPAIAPGDTLHVVPLCTDERSAPSLTGSVVVYEHEGRIRAHRLVRVEPCHEGHAWVCRGDNLDQDDPSIRPHHVLGRVVQVTEGARTLRWHLGVLRHHCAHWKGWPSRTRDWFGAIARLATRLRRSRRRAMGAYVASLGLWCAALGVSARSDAQTATERGWQLASSSALKLVVHSRGWTRVTQPELVAAGLDPDIDPRSLGLVCNGEPVAILVRGEQDGRLDATDALEWFAQAVDTPVTDANVYWLAANGTQPARIQSTAATSTLATHARGRLSAYTAVQTYHIAREATQYRTLYVAAIQNGDADNFFGPLVTDAIPAGGGISGGVETHFTLSALRTDVGVTPRLRFVFQAVTQGEHRIRLWVNEHPAPDLVFGGAVREVLNVDIDAAWLVSGSNSIRVARTSPQDLVVIDDVELTYPRSLVAIDHALAFENPADTEATVSGFATPDIEVFDVTDPRAPVAVSATVTTTTSGPVGYRVHIAPYHAPRALWVVTGAAKRPVAALRQNAPSSWHAATHAGELVVIAHPSLMQHVGPLVTQRTLEGWSVALVDIQDVYDEFSFGIKDPAAIKRLLKRARDTWQTPPKHVLLVGDASFDSRNRLGLGDHDLVSTHYIGTAQLETSSDDWFVDHDDDGIPELAIGRIPARTPEQLAIAVQKSLSLTPALAGAPLQGLFVNDRPDGFDFTAASRRMVQFAGPQLQATLVTRQPTESGMLPAMLDALTAKPEVVTYVGHGSTQIWAGSTLTHQSVANLPALGDHYPLYLTMTCLNGYFHDVTNESLGEALLFAEGRGAAAAWVSSGFTEPRWQESMMAAALKNLATEQNTIGEAFRLAKREALNEDVRRTWLLLGDPSLRLRPAPPRAAQPSVPDDAPPPSADSDNMDPHAGPAGTDMGPSNSTRDGAGCSVQPLHLARDNARRAPATTSGKPSTTAWMFATLTVALALRYRRRRRS